MKQTTRPALEHKHQRGATTLLMATVLLMAVSMIGVYSARSSVAEQRIAANSVWSQQTSDAAQSAMDNIATFKQEDLKNLSGGLTAITFSNDASVNAATGVSKNNSAISVPAGMMYTANVNTTDAFNTLDIDMRVTAANGVAEQRVFQRAKFGSFLVEIPQGAVTALGDATVTTILNVPIAAPTNIKASKATQKAATIPAKAGICPRKAAMMAKTVNSAKAPTTTAATSVTLVTPPNGSSLDGLSPAQVEANFFSDSGQHLKETAQHYIACGTGAGACTFANVTGKTGFIWIEGDLVLDGGGTTPPNTLGLFGTVGTPGTPAAENDGLDSTPVLLVVNGNLTIRNGAVVNGLIFTRGDWLNVATNAGTVNGAVIVNGTGNGNGSVGNESGDFSAGSNLVINYEFYILENVMKLGSFVRVAGSWRDF